VKIPFLFELSPHA